MDAADSRRIALSPEGVEEGSDMASPDFRVAAEYSATLAAVISGVRQPDAHSGGTGWLCMGAAQCFIRVAAAWGNGRYSCSPLEAKRRPLGWRPADSIEGPLSQKRTSEKATVIARTRPGENANYGTGASAPDFDIFRSSIDIAC